MGEGALSLARPARHRQLLFFSLSPFPFNFCSFSRLYGIRLWPGIVIGDLLLGDFSTPLGTVLAQTVGNTVALVIAALLLRRLTRGRGSLERVADVLALVACAVRRRARQRGLRAAVAALGRRDRPRRARARLPDLDAR